MIVSFHTLGCRLNQAEEEALTRKFLEEGYFLSEPSEADICIVNTCSVTALADKKSRQAIRSLKNKNPKLSIIVIGCGAETAQKLPEVKMCIENKDKNRVFEIITSEFKSHRPKKIINSVSSGPDTNLASKRSGQGASKTRTRALLKIQDGCNNFCSYCIVPLFRGREMSYNVEDIVQEAKKLERLGYNELVISGVNVGKYILTQNVEHKTNDSIALPRNEERAIQNGKLQSATTSIKKLKEKTQNNGLVGLVEVILKETNFFRIRLSSINPEDVADEMIDLWAKNPRLCRHFHLSLQSGSNLVLKKMGRPYTREFYLDLCNKITQNIPDVAITTDVIVGFPGETEKDFLATKELVTKAKLAKIHVFRYSKRKGTRAAGMEDQVSEETKKVRANELARTGDELRNNFIQKQIGKKVEVLFEEKNGSSWYGLTDNYIKVEVKSEESIDNKIKSVLVTDIKNGIAQGEIYEN